MPLYRPRYLVEYDPAQPPIEVVVSSGDMMRAELEAKKLKLPEGTPFHTTALWLWSALVRAGREERVSQAFLADPPEWQPVTTPSGEQDGEQVDPTLPGSGVTDSGAPQYSVTPDSGLTTS